jgi:molecular chaperone DnaK
MNPCIGIDFGTTNSVVAFMDGDEARIIPNARGARLTPTIVGFRENGEVLTGESAKNQAVANASNTIALVKRIISEDRKFYPGRKVFTPIEIAAIIFQNLKGYAQDYLGKTVKEAFISVPANFHEPQRRAIKRAAELAGLEVRAMLNEPTAAALAYAVNTRQSGNILVYDFGGGTFDATVLKKNGNDYQVLSSVGDNKLGGADLDQEIYRAVKSKFEAEITLTIDPMLKQQLYELVEKMKIELSSSEYSELTLPFVKTNAHFSFGMQRAKLEELIKPYVERTIKLTRQALEEADVKNVDHVILSGGSSRIPLVARSITDLLGLKPESRINPDEVVALGTAVFSGLEKKRIRMRDITSFSLGVEIDKGVFQPILMKNTQLPAIKSQTFTTIDDYQSSVEIHILQGESKKVINNTSLGKFLLKNIRQGRQGEPKVDVQFRVDSDGLLHVKAKDRDTGSENAVALNGESQNYGDVYLRNLKERLSFLSKRLDLDLSTKKEIKELLSELDTESLQDRIIRIESLIAELEYSDKGVSYDQV